MNNLKNQKFMSLFNEMLADRQGTLAGKIFEPDFKNKKGDEVDLVNQEKEESLTMRLSQRNVLFLKKVEEAKQKILDGSYGICEECGDDISQKRLMARPTACLCINCQEDKEKGEFQNFNKRRDLSNKQLSNEDASINGHLQNGKKFNKVSDIEFESVVDL